MTKQYYKKGLITAEQFDESGEMIAKYHLEEVATGMIMTPNGPDEVDGFVINTLEGALEVKHGDWIATGVNGEQWAIADDVFRKTYAELPAIPQKVADYIQKAKAGTWGIIDCFYHVGDNVSACGLNGVRKWERWIVDHQDDFACAWLYGYQIAENDYDRKG